MVAPTVPASGDLRAILINNDAEKTNNLTVDLILSADDATEMNLSTSSTFDPLAWESFCTAKEFELDGPGDGLKEIYVKFRSADLTESDVFSASITLDTAPPKVGTVPVMINGGDLVTTSRVTTLTLDATGASVIEILNEDELSSFQGTQMSYATTVSWTLSPGNGRKQVYVKFIDDIGNATSFLSAEVVLRGQQSGENFDITEPVNGTYTTDKFITARGTADFNSEVEIRITPENGE